jgi:ferredoxin
MKKIISVKIDRDICLDHGLCAHECPEVFGTSEDGEPIVKSDAPRHYQTHQKKIEYVANEVCPVEAIKIQYEKKHITIKSSATSALSRLGRLFKR